jgi:hypothetical protein
MRIDVNELTPGCGEWCACLFNRYGQPMLSVKSTKSATDAEEQLEDLLQEILDEPT